MCAPSPPVAMGWSDTGLVEFLFGHFIIVNSAIAFFVNRTTTKRRTHALNRLRTCHGADERGAARLQRPRRPRRPQPPARPDDEGRRHHGRREPRAGEDRRGCGSGGRDGPRARPGRHPRPRRRGSHERPHHDRGHRGSRVHPRHGEVPHRALRGSPGAAEPRRRLHRRERGAHAGRRRVPCEQVGLRRAVRVRRPQPGRGPAPHRRGRGR